jgi:hypothetical protein
MNCDLVQRRLLSSADPETVPADLRAHLAVCGCCRDWQQHLVQIDRNIPLLPVPRSRGRARLLQRFLPQAEQAENRQEREKQIVPSPVARSSPPPLRLGPGRMSWTVRLAAATAALVLIALLGVFGLHYLNWPPQDPPPAPAPLPPANPLLAGLVQHDLRLATAATPRERIVILADLADEMLDPARALAVETAGGQLDALARLYERVIREGILKQARSLPVAERCEILAPITQQLARTASRMDRLLQKTSGTQSRPLESIAGTARDANRQLYSLVAEVRS